MFTIIQKTILSLLLTTYLSGCVRNQKVPAQTSQPNFNQTQFTFFVFERFSVDSFFLTYKPISVGNGSIRTMFSEVLLNERFEDNKKMEELSEAYSTNTEPLSQADFELAKQVLKESLKPAGEKYFTGSLDYLFFYSCLPKKFQYKWSQSTLGHFEFNANFFDLLRNNCKALDDIIYGNQGYRADDMKAIFGEYIFNEITPETALQIKKAITSNPGFNDSRFAIDRTNFLEFLDKTIATEWRLILIDWD